jgi:hypothetical protein
MTKANVRWMRSAVSVATLGLLGLFVLGCTSSSSTQATSGPPVYILAITSVANQHEQITAVSPADNEGVTAGTTGLSLIYNPGTSVTVTAAASDNSGAFLGWCDASSVYTSPFTCVAPPCTSVSGLTCTVKMSANLNLLATYPGVTGVVISPTNTSALIPATTQFTVTVNGLGTCTVPITKVQVPCQGSPYTLALTGPTGYAGPLGTISTTGLYTPVFPTAPTVYVTASSAILPGAANIATLTLTSPTPSTGPALSVDVGSPTHAISPNIYGMNDYNLDPTLPALVNLPVERWGGDLATRYNYLTDADNSAADSFFETSYPSTSGYPLVSQFNSQVTQDRMTHTKTLATVPLIGYTTIRQSACSYSVTKYGAQTEVDPNRKDCGNGLLGALAASGGTPIKNDPTDTSMVIDQTFVSGWVNFLVGQFGTAANGGVAIYGLDNEPEYWSGVHKDVHPVPLSYDELSNKGLAYAAAIKAQDPSALVSGPVISNWTQYFYSATDVANGYNHNPSCPQANPTDRLAHGDVPLIEYYLQQFQKYQTANNTRLLDYVDIHTYFAAAGAYGAPGDSTAGNITLQLARLNSTRVFWDPTYTDPAYTDPTDTPTTTACKGTAYPPNLINTMKGWVSRDYPGTKLAITEYNWGGLESINGALTQADILGIFGREGLDLGVMWGPPVPSNGTTLNQQPGVVAFQVYTNYDGQSSHFGETAVTSTSANQGTLSVYGATRAADNMLTIVVINKGLADLTSTLSLPNLKPNGSAKAYLYSSANLNSLIAQPSVPVTTGTPNTITTLFPAYSITLLVVPHL